MNKILKFFLDLLFPIYCVNCKKEGEWVCDECVGARLIAPVQNIQLIAPVQNNNISNLIEKKNIDNLTYIDQIFYFYDFNNDIISNLIYTLKYKYAYDVARFIADKIYNDLFLFIKTYNKSILVPIPLNKNRFNERGFNQSEVILKNVRGAINRARTKYSINRVHTKYAINCDSKSENLNIINLLKRIKNTGHQANLSKEDRDANLKGAFILDNGCDISNFSDSTIILFDDVVTTGNTIDKCAKVLRDNGFKGKIIGLCFAGQN